MSRHRDLAPPQGTAPTPPTCRSRAAGAVVLGLALSMLLFPPFRPSLGAAPARRAATARAPKSDMQVTVSASAGFASGFNATYTITAVNNGPQSAPGPITITDTLPAGLTYTSSTAPAGWTCAAAGQVVTCTLPGALIKFSAQTFTIVAAITSAVATSVTNIVTASDVANDDTNLANNRATVTSAVTVRRVATTPDGATATQLPSNGTNYTQTFVVTNAGNIADSYTLAASVAPAGVVTIISVRGVSGTTGTTGSLAVGAADTVNVVYSVATGAATGATATVTFTATGTFTGSATDGGSVIVTVARAGLTMAKALYRDDQTTLVTGPAGVQPGEYVQYKVTVTSSGGAAANSVSVSDGLPATVTYTSSAGDAAGWTITNAAGTVTANLGGALAAGASRYFWLRVRVK